MSKQVLSVKEMEHLKKLGVYTSKASMCWMIFDVDSLPSDLWIHSADCYDYDFAHPIPTFTLQDILDILPKEIIIDSKVYNLNIIFPNEGSWEVSYSSYSICKEFFIENNLIDAAYEMLCWCVENGYKLNKI